MLHSCCLKELNCYQLFSHSQALAILLWERKTAIPSNNGNFIKLSIDLKHDETKRLFNESLKLTNISRKLRSFCLPYIDFTTMKNSQLES